MFNEGAKLSAKEIFAEFCLRMSSSKKKVVADEPHVSLNLQTRLDGYLETSHKMKDHIAQDTALFERKLAKKQKAVDVPKDLSLVDLPGVLFPNSSFEHKKSAAL